MALGERERRILDIERGWWLDGRSKTEVVRAQLRVSLTRYNQLLAQLLDKREAEDYDPLVVRRLRRAKQKKRWAALGARPANGRHEG